MGPQLDGKVINILTWMTARVNLKIKEKNDLSQGFDGYLGVPGAGWSGKLTIMDIETKKYWQSDLTPNLYGGTPDQIFYAFLS